MWIRATHRRGAKLTPNCRARFASPPTKLSEARQFIRSIKVNYPILLGSIEAKALFEQGETLPITVVIDPEGSIHDLIEGILLPEEFEQKIKPLLR